MSDTKQFTFHGAFFVGGFVNVVVDADGVVRVDIMRQPVLEQTSMMVGLNAAAVDDETKLAIKAFSAQRILEAAAEAYTEAAKQIGAKIGDLPRPKEVV